MTPPFDQPVLSMWESEGIRAAAALDACAAAVVVGEDPAAAAEVALGLARAQARRRRVIVADAVGELGPLEDLVPMDAPYGLADVILYGVSLVRAVHAIDPARNLNVLPSGPAPLDHDALLTSELWPRLAADFRAGEGLLLVIAPQYAAALPRFASVMDGSVLIGAAVAPLGSRVLAHIRAPSRPAPKPASTSPALATDVALPPPPVEPPRPLSFDALASARYAPGDARREEPKPSAPGDAETELASPAMTMPAPLGETTAFRVPTFATPVAVPPREALSTPPGASEPQQISPLMLATVKPAGARAVPMWLGIGSAAVIAVAIVTWGTQRILSPGSAAPPAQVAASRASGAAADSAAPGHRSGAAPAAGAAGVAASASAPPRAADSANAAAFGVALVDVGSITGAHSQVEQQVASGLPAVTISPLARADGGRSYLVIAGAFRAREQADSLLQLLRDHHTLGRAQGHVVHAPYALLVQTGISAEQAPTFVNAYHLKGLPVYGLQQSDGTVTLYAGAFERPDDAQSLLASFRANGESPSVTFRIGRTP